MAKLQPKRDRRGTSIIRTQSFRRARPMNMKRCIRKTARAGLLLLAGLALPACFNKTYPGGFRTWTPEMPRSRAAAVDKKYRETQVTYNLDLDKHGKRRAYTPSELAEKIRKVVDTDFHPYIKTEIEDTNPATGKPYKIQLGLGPIEKDMAWPVLANAFNMTSHNQIRAFSWTHSPWQMGQVVLLATPTPKFDMLSKKQTQQAPKPQVITPPEVVGPDPSPVESVESVEITEPPLEKQKSAPAPQQEPAPQEEIHQPEPASPLELLERLLKGGNSEGEAIDVEQAPSQPADSDADADAAQN